MAIYQDDIKLKKTQVMQDVPEGGGAPVPEDIPDGGNNTIFPDVSESDRAGGRFNLRKIVVHVNSPNVDEYMGANVIVARPPDDPNVSVTMLRTADLFDRRADAANRVEGYLTAGALWQGYLYTDHVAGQRNIQVFQRPGSPVPTIGRTLVLTYRAGMSDERQQYVRLLSRDVQDVTFTYTGGGTPVEYQAQLVNCQISDPLRFDFPGSEASRFFTAEANKTVLRDTTVADSGSYCGTQPLVEPAELGDVRVKVASVYTQLVPNSRTERTELDVLPAAIRSIVLQETPRRIEIASSPHTRRLKIGQENRAFNYVDILRPIPAPGTLDVSYMALGEWYSIRDDGTGKLTGSGVGTVNYTTGSVSITLQALPDTGTMVIYTWGERAGYVNRAGQATFRKPEYVFELQCDGMVPASGHFAWYSAQVPRYAYVTEDGRIYGDAEGEINTATNTVYLRPHHMIDAGGQFGFYCAEIDTVTDSFTSIALDPAGYGTLTLSDIPAPGSVSVEWTTVRNVSKSSGGSASSTASAKGTLGGDSAFATDLNARVAQVVAPVDAGAFEAPAIIRRTDTGTQMEASMFPGGKTATGRTVYIAVEPTKSATGPNYSYQVPDVSAVVWTAGEVELGRKVIGGVTYRVWGTHNAVI